MGLTPDVRGISHSDCPRRSLWTLRDNRCCSGQFCNFLHLMGLRRGVGVWVGWAVRGMGGLGAMSWEDVSV